MTRAHHYERVAACDVGLPRARQAGGFALEDPDLGALVDKMEGSVDSIFGLPVDLLCTLVARASV